METLGIIWKLMRTFMSMSMLFRLMFCISYITGLIYIIFFMDAGPLVDLLVMYSLVGMLWMWEMGSALSEFTTRLEHAVEDTINSSGTVNKEF